MVWSETTPCPDPSEDAEAWSACCEAKGWDWSDPVCAAWGPPMPPRMPSAMASMVAARMPSLTLPDQAPGTPGIMLA